MCRLILKKKKKKKERERERELSKPERAILGCLQDVMYIVLMNFLDRRYLLFHFIYFL